VTALDSLRYGDCALGWMFPAMTNTYETDQLLNEYLLMHYGTEQQLMPWGFGPKEALDFPVRTVAHFPEMASERPSRRALDIGCAVGRSSFELSRDCDEVIGVDYSQNFITAAEQIRRDGSCGYQVRETGQLASEATAQLPEGARAEVCRFIQGDAMDLSRDLGCFDRVHVANLICRLSEPEKLLNRLPELVCPSGYMVLATPCTWLDEYTPRDHQPDGDTFDWLGEKLGASFTLVQKTDEPFLIRETARKFQWTVSLVSVWQRRD
jgi:putative 4-mercaptohistidine N1-methyltranferase